MKLGVSGALGIPVDYYLLVNLNGFRQIVDAIGGITVNVNERVPINGDTDRHIPPTGYIEPGPHQHLNGFKALWFTRGRYGSTDYKRMERQRCALNAIVDAGRPGPPVHALHPARQRQQEDPAHRRARRSCCRRSSTPRSR